MEKLFISKKTVVPSHRCYACKNNLCGKMKENYHDNSNYEEFWECHCTVEEVKLVQNFFCPICVDFNKASEYLNSVITDKKTLWLANMITHYRHHHISWWDKKYGRNSVYKVQYGDYETEKLKVNNSTKRQILRKCLLFLNNHGFCRENFLTVKDNDQATIDLIKKLLTK